MDFDDASEISHQAGMNLLFSDVPAEIDERYEDDNGVLGKGREYTIEKLNGGLSKEMFEEYKDKITEPKEDPALEMFCKRPLVIFVALLMQLGASLTEEQNAFTYTVVGGVDFMMPDAKEQVRQAFNGYENGHPWEFRPDTIVDAANKPAERDDPMNTKEGPILINIMPGGDRRKIKDDKKASLKRCQGCFTRQKALPYGVKFKIFGRCKSAAFCDKSCQKLGWRIHHKQVCAILANQDG